jgi:uncharacterized protein YjeT (DUF2065 family)
MDWSDLAAAFALYLVIEGLVPFLNPGGMKRTLLKLTQLDERTLRGAGLASIIIGLALLYFARSQT